VRSTAHPATISASDILVNPTRWRDIAVMAPPGKRSERTGSLFQFVGRPDTSRAASQ